MAKGIMFNLEDSTAKMKCFNLPPWCLSLDYCSHYYVKLMDFDGLKY